MKPLSAKNKQVVKKLLILTTFILLSIMIYSLKQDLDYQNSTNLNVNEAVELIKNDYIIINQDGYIRYRGYASDILNSGYRNREVKEIAYCDDREYTITIFI